MSFQRKRIDPTWQYFHPLETLEFDEGTPLVCRCAGLWKHWAQLDHLGPMMQFSDYSRAILIDGGLPLTDLPTKKLNLQFPGHYFSMLRLLVYLGCSSEARKLFDSVFSDNEKKEDLRVFYLNVLLNVVSQTAIDIIGSWNVLKEAQVSHGPESILLGLILYRRSSFLHSQIRGFLKKTIPLSGLEKWEQALAFARLYRIDSELFALANNPKASEEAFTRSLSIVSKSETQITEKWQYQLYMETKRRLLEYGYRLSHKYQEMKKASTYALQMVKLDPNCARALLLAGIIHLEMGFQSQAADYLSRASFSGIVERPYANALLAKCFSKQPRMFFLEEAFRSAFFRRDLKTILNTSEFPTSMEIADLKKNAYIRIELSDLRERLLSEPILEMFSSYWLPDYDHKGPRPLSAIIPELSRRSFEKNPIPFFSTYTLQRTLVPGFRRELLHASNGWRWLPDEAFIRYFDWKAQIHLESFPDFRNIPTSPMKQAYFSRYLASLGFFSEAITFLKPIIKEDCKTLEHCFAKTVYLWIIHFFLTKDCSNYLRDLSSHFSNLPDCVETLRMRLTIAILGTVISGKAQRIVECEHWRSKALIVLSTIQNSSMFEDREKILLESRAFRAISYLPFLRKDKKQLLDEKEIFLQRAYALSEQFAHNVFIFKDNLFAALESSGRIFEVVGQPEKALDFMQRIVDEVDPLDSKAWLQVGELQRKLGNISEALKSFLTAVKIGAPHGPIASYSAGCCAKKLGDDLLAKHLFLHSAQLFSEGISPLIQLVELAEKNKDFKLKRWSLSRMDELKTKMKQNFILQKC